MIKRFLDYCAFLTFMTVAIWPEIAAIVVIVALATFGVKR